MTNISFLRISLVVVVDVAKTNNECIFIFSRGDDLLAVVTVVVVDVAAINQTAFDHYQRSRENNLTRGERLCCRFTG